MKNSMSKLIEIIKTLRGPDGCPWDKKQTPATLIDCLWEESTELSRAILNNDMDNIEEELGDVILVIFMIITIYQENNHTDFKKVIDKLNDKLIRRHPHVFGELNADNHLEALKHWNEQKQKERPRTEQKNQDNLLGFFDTLLDKQADKKSPFVASYMIQEEMAKNGFDWKDSLGPLEKIKEEVQEIEQEIKKPETNKNALALEIGDLLFSVINFSRKEKISPEKALFMTLQKIKSRFEIMHKLDSDFLNSDLDTMNQLWEESKNPKTAQNQ